MKSVQLVPAGAKQVAPGIFQMTRRGGSRGGHHKKHGKHPTTHRRALPLMSQSFVRYVKKLNSFRSLAKNFTAPDWVDVPALLLYIDSQSKKDKGGMNVAKTMLLDRAAQKNPQIAQMLAAGAGDLGMLGLLGGFGNRGPLTGIQGSPISTPTGASGGGPVEIVADARAATDLINAVENV